MTEQELSMLIDRHQAELFRYLRYLGAADREVAEELVQDVFVAAWHGPMPPEDRPGRQAAWLRGVARNKFLMHCRSRRRDARQVTAGALEQAESVWVGAGQDDARDVRRAALRECLDLLTTRQRQAVELRYGRTASRSDIATRLRMTENGAKSLLQRTRALLADCIQRRVAAR
jgi:RNA polymerase sigma-70 factor (ECF subfamily)